MNCIIIEDQRPAQEILEKYIEDLGSLRLVGTYRDALQSMEILKTQSVELIFLDIHLPKLSGLDFLKTLSNPPHVILTTAFPDYALESYDLSVVDYLLKPFSFQRFVKAVSKAQLLNESQEASKVESDNDEPHQIFVKSGYDMIRLSVHDIFFLRSDSDYTEIHLINTKHLSAEPLKHWEAQLNRYDFIRIHKSYVVNFSKILKVSGNQVFLSDQIALPIGRAYKEGFNQRLLQ